MRSGNVLSFICLLTALICAPLFTMAQKPTSVGTYLCSAYDGFTFNMDYKPVKYVERMFWPEMTSAEAWLADSLVHSSDTIYLDAMIMQDYVKLGGLTPKEKGEMIAAMKSFQHQKSPGTLDCLSLHPKPTYDETLATFSQPVYNAARTKCIVTMELTDIQSPKKSNPYRERIILYFYKGKWTNGSNDVVPAPVKN